MCYITNLKSIQSRHEVIIQGSQKDKMSLKKLRVLPLGTLTCNHSKETVKNCLSYKKGRLQLHCSKCQQKKICGCKNVRHFLFLSRLTFSTLVH